ncbi:hypothetical protein [Cognaticolwellia mytili]|uniref:hypothetical protein n=1 Tax=Cognaticolwellia mytili TaxID=1888913 RepID=UPI000A1707BB|nr:hypothetical protein [Cognaticolwellia mytili]
MNNMLFTTRNIFFASSLLLLQACGGGSGNSVDSTPSDFTPNAINTGIISFDKEIKTSQPVDLFIYFPDDNLSNIHWTQTAGSNVTFHAGTSKGIAFTPEVAGEYSFQVSFTRNGVSEQLTHSFSVSNEVSKIGARLGHATLEGSDVSLRVSLANSTIRYNSIKWQQISGPTVTFTEPTDGNSAIFFNAPAVNADSFVEFKVSASDGSSSYNDMVTILIEDAATIIADENIAYGNRLARVFPFKANSPYADVLTKCIYDNTIDFRSTCRLNELPLIAQDTTNPKIDDIMNRVLVSHQWMGERFQAFLQDNDSHGDFKNLLRATTAIVISYDIRPSYYWAVTGAIHLDPSNLWLTPEERDTINQAPDFRASYGDSLNFVMPWRYVKNNSYANFFYPEDVRIGRDAADGVHELAALMYHELAHANDYFPQSVWASLNRNDRILDAVERQQKTGGIQSDKLATALPLNGTEMYRLAQVRYQGDTATATEKNYSPSDVAGFFSPEHSPHFYNYSSLREDYAMLFDELMMKVRFDVDRDIAITNQPQSAAEEYIVEWGQRGRIGENNIKPRVDYVTRRILPEFTTVNEAINNLATPIIMQNGKTWAENLTISPVSKKATNKDANESPLNRTIHYRINADGEVFYEKPMPLKLGR